MYRSDKTFFHATLPAYMDAEKDRRIRKYFFTLWCNKYVAVALVNGERYLPAVGVGNEVKCSFLAI